MTDDKESLKGVLFTLDVNASFNEHYYQKLAWMAAFADRVVRITVGILAILSLAYSSDPYWSWNIAFAALCAAVVLNILPLQKWELEFRVLQSKWGELRAEALELEIAIYHTVIDLNFLVQTKDRLTGAISPAHREQLIRLVNRRTLLHSQDIIRWQWLSDRLFEKEYERRYGKGIKNSKLGAVEFERLLAARNASENAVA